MLAAMGVGGTEGMTAFYDTCLATLYPPGQCAEDCTPSMMHCRLMEVQSACCSDPSNCPEGDATPHECPVECALVFPFFLDSCGDVLAEQGGDMDEYAKFSRACERQDTVDLVEFAMRLQDQGCTMSLDEAAGGGGDENQGHRRAEDDDDDEESLEPIMITNSTETSSTRRLQATHGKMVGVGQQLSWDDAREYCQRHHFDLASIHSEQDNADATAACQGIQGAAEGSNWCCKLMLLFLNLIALAVSLT